MSRKYTRLLVCFVLSTTSVGCSGGSDQSDEISSTMDTGNLCRIGVFEDKPEYLENCWNIDLSGANLRGAHLSGAKMANADFSNADLTGADLSFASLNNANFSGANLTNANLNGARTMFANFSGADLSFATMPNGMRNGVLIFP